MRLRGVPLDERQALGQFVAKRDPDRRERIVIRRFRKRPRRQHREVVVMMLRILIVVVVIMPDQLVIHAGKCARAMLRREMPDGDKPPEQDERRDEPWGEFHGAVIAHHAGEGNRVFSPCNTPTALVATPHGERDAPREMPPARCLGESVRQTLLSIRAVSSNRRTGLSALQCSADFLDPEHHPASKIPNLKLPSLFRFLGKHIVNDHIHVKIHADLQS